MRQGGQKDQERIYQQQNQGYQKNNINQQRSFQNNSKDHQQMNHLKIPQQNQNKNQQQQYQQYPNSKQTIESNNGAEQRLNQDNQSRQQRFIERQSKTRQQSQTKKQQQRQQDESDQSDYDNDSRREQLKINKTGIKTQVPSTRAKDQKQHKIPARHSTYSSSNERSPSYRSSSSLSSTPSNRNLDKKRVKSKSARPHRSKSVKKSQHPSHSSIMGGGNSSIVQSHVNLHHGHTHHVSTMQNNKTAKKKDGKKKKEGNEGEKMDKKSESNLVQRLLMDITEKYKGLNNAQSSCYINKLEKKTMVHEINVLAKALIKSEKKYVKIKESSKQKSRELKKVIKSQATDINLQGQEILQLQESVRQLKQQEEYLMNDLVKQQKIAKDSLRALDNLSDKYDREKRELIVRLEREKDDALKREDAKFEAKINSIKALNDQLNSKLGTLHETEDDFSALQKNYNEAITIIEDQKRELQTSLSEIEDLRTRNGQLEDEVRDVQGMLQEQQKLYSSHINELRVQLGELEEATRNKYEEQIVQMQLELKMKQDTLQRQAQEKDLLERKLRQKLEEAGLSTKQIQREVQERDEQQDELRRQLKNQEFEIEKLKRVINNKEEELELEKKRFTQKMERRGAEYEREKQEWNEMYQALQREISNLKQSLQEKDNQLQHTIRRSIDNSAGIGSYKGSTQLSPSINKIGNQYGEGANSNQVLELQEQLRTKEEEIKILWNVIKEINKSKGTEKVNMDQLKNAISQKINSHTVSLSQ